MRQFQFAQPYEGLYTNCTVFQPLSHISPSTLKHSTVQAHLLSKLEAFVIQLELIHQLADAEVSLVEDVALRSGLIGQTPCHIPLMLPLLLSYLKLG